MNKEPLDCKILFLSTRAVIDRGYNHYFNALDVKSAVEWLKNELCDCTNISPVIEQCHTCNKIEEAFPDLK